MNWRMEFDQIAMTELEQVKMELAAHLKTAEAWNEAADRAAATLLARERLLCAIYQNRRGWREELQRLVLDDSREGLACVLDSMSR